MKTIINKITIVLLLITRGLFSAQEKLPNIIYIYADDLGYGSSSPYGNKLIETPNLEKLAKEGIKFTQHYAGAPVCAPSRGMLLTGKHSGHSFIRGNYEFGGFQDDKEGGQMPLPEGVFTLPKMMKEAGYTTAAFGKWGLGMPTNSGNPNSQGFDYFFGIMDQKQAHNYYPTHLWRNSEKVPLNNQEVFVHTALDPKTATEKDFEKFIGKEYAPQRILDETLQYLKKNKDRPFFIYFATPLPHPSLQVPKEYRDRYVGKFQEPEFYYGQHGYAPVKYPYSSFAGMITYLDMQVGEIMKTLKKLGLEDNTLVLFSSDNGGTLESGIPNDLFDINGDLRGFKQDLFEGGIREPFLVKWPKHIKPGSTSDLVSTQYDVMATLAELIRFPLKDTDGISFLPTLLGKKKQINHPYLYWEFPEKGGSLAVRQGNWKAVKVGLKKDLNAPWQLFDLKRDPNESSDIAAQHPEILKDFDDIVKKEHKGATIREWEIVDPK